MIRRPLVLALTLAAALAAGAAHAAQICAWMTETSNEDNFHEVTLWMQADADVDFYYMIKGEGLKADDGDRFHSPGSGTYVLHKGEADKPWGFGATLYPPGEIDIVAEVHAWPKDIFKAEDSPLLTSFTFHRRVPDGEETPPKTLAARQCKTVTVPPHD
jgi:hypothetical protein